MGRIVLDRLCKRFGRAEVIRDVSLAIEDGELAVFVGPSGSGKSTLLRLIAGLEPATSGRVLIDGRDVTALEPVDRGLAMVFQSYALYPHMTVRGNMAFALETARAPRSTVAAKVAEAARALKLDALLDRRPSELSGGQRQRVAIGRAIVRDPVAFLFDEPLSNLDAALRAETRREIARLHKALGRTMIYVTHDQVEAMTLADRIVVLREGRVEQAGPPMALFREPANAFVAGFLGSPSMNFLPVEVRAADGGRAVVSGAALEPLELRPRAPVAPGPARLGIRPQHLAPVEGGGRLRGRVARAERLGVETVLEVTLADGTAVVAALPRDRAFEPGAPVALGFDPEDAHLFPA